MSNHGLKLKPAVATDNWAKSRSPGSHPHHISRSGVQPPRHGPQNFAVRPEVLLSPAQQDSRSENFVPKKLGFVWCPSGNLVTLRELQAGHRSPIGGPTVAEILID